jgi:hypothetical protein
MNIYQRVIAKYGLKKDRYCRGCSHSLDQQCWKNPAKPFELPEDAQACKEFEEWLLGKGNPHVDRQIKNEMKID